jgi:4-hydroxymandelate oxidase
VLKNVPSQPSIAAVPPLNEASEESDSGVVQMKHSNRIEHLVGEGQKWRPLIDENTHRPSTDAFSRADTDVELVCLADFEPLAKAGLQPSAWEYLIAGAGDELTIRWNREAYERIRLNPRLLVDVSHLDTKMRLFGQEHSFPILVAPIAAQTLFHPEGELATARGAAAAQSTMVLSSFSSNSLEDVAAAAKTPLWFQLYSQADHGLTRELVQRAEDAGYGALCLTVDTPVAGVRNREARARIQPPPLPNLRVRQQTGSGSETDSEKLANSLFNAALNWNDLERLCSIVKIPLLLKGVLNPDDADEAAKVGVAGIVVSNHAGRNLDTVPATIDALPRVAERVAGRVPLLLDGGIRRGTDVLKALALGASAVLIGRPYVFGLAVAGEKGVSKVLNILQSEFRAAMALTGRTNIAEINRSVLWPL